MQSQIKLEKSYSCEFFPPKTEKGMENLYKTSEILSQKISPSFFSVTFGAGGSTRETTFDAVTKVARHTGIDVAPHLSCIGSTKDQLLDILESYKQQGIKRIVTLRGDLPSGTAAYGDFSHASELVAFIRENYNDHFHLEVAAYPEFHPQAQSAETDLQFFREKVLAGASSAITQYFYNVDSYFYFVDSCEKMGLDLPIVPGIMPITNYSNLARFSNLCGAEIPQWIRRRLEAYADDVDSIKDFGAEVVTNMCQKLIDSGAPGLHFYTMNQTEATLRIWNNLSR